MESWQIDQINNNLPSLLSNTDCNIQLLAELKSRKLLSDIDTEMIEVKKAKQCKTNLLYNILKTRTNAYYELINSLTATKQTGAAKILMRISTDRLKSLKVVFLGFETQLNHLLDNRQIGEIQEWLNVKIPSDDLLKMNHNLSADKNLQLLTNTIPEPYSLYIPRLLTRRLVVNPEAFQRISPDIFVLKNISQHMLRNIVRREIDSSTNQVRKSKLTAQFIILDSETDWERICRKVDCSVHLIRYEESMNAFELERTLGCSMEFYEYLQQKGESVSEEGFVNMCLKERNNVCICDSPGMGKSLLLANLARKFQEQYTDRVVGFIQLKDLISEEENGSKRDTVYIKTKIFEAISTSAFASRLLYEIAKKKDIKFELFLDGLDEVQGSQLELTIQFLRTLSETIPTARIYVTSRPIMRNHLEEALDVISYDIQPFTKETQISFLLNFWTRQNRLSNVCKLKEYATICLQNVLDALKENEKEITGIPLQCRLIAEVYAEEAEIYADPARTVIVRLTEFSTTSLLQIYSKYVVSTLGETKCNFACMHVKNGSSAQCSTDCFVRNFHVWKALELIFPNFAMKLAASLVQCSAMYKCRKLEQWNRRKIMSPNLLIITDNAGCFKVEFVHRTFAEYLVAEYFVKAIFVERSEQIYDENHHKEIQRLGLREIFSTRHTNTPPVKNLFARLFFFIFETHNSDQTLRENVVAYFINAMITQNPRAIGHLHTHDFPSYRSHYNLVCCLVDALPGCVRQNYEVLIDIIINIKLPSKPRFPYPIVTSCKEANTNLRLAVKLCSKNTIEKLEQFFSIYCASTDNFFSNDMLHTAIKRADYDICCFIFEKIELENNGLLYCCVENTYLKDDDVVEKILAIAELLLSKCGELLTESYCILDGAISLVYKSPLLLPKIHLKAIKFLVSIGASVWVADANGLTVLHLAANYMSTKHFLQLCYFLFVECNAENILLKPKRWKKFCYGVKGSLGISANKLVSLLYLLYFLETGKLSSENETLEFFTNLDLLECLQDLLLDHTFYSKYQQGFVTLFYLAILEGSVEIVDLLLTSNNLLLEMEFEYENNQTPLMLSIKYKQELMISFLISKGANIYAVDDQGNTILHLLAQTQNCSLFAKVLKILGELWDENLTTVGPGCYTQNAASTRKTPQKFAELFNWKERELSRTPLHYAMKYLLNMPLETFQLFLTGGKSFETGQEESSITLIVEINAVDSRNKNVLYHALDNKQNLNVIRYLVKHGANWSNRDIFGHEVIKICRWRELPDHLEYFKKLRCFELLY